MKEENTLKTIMNKLAENKTELATHKIQLSLVDEIAKLEASVSSAVKQLSGSEKVIKTFQKELKAKYKEGEKIEKAVNSGIKSFSKLEDKAYKLIDKAEKVAKMVGIKPSEIKDFNNLYDSLNDLEELTGDLPQLLDWMYT